MEWVIGYIVVWLLFSGYLASDNPKDEENVVKSVFIGAVWIVVLPLGLLFLITEGIGTLIKKVFG